MLETQARDHGGGLDAAVAAYGGDRSSWIDLSTGINPNPYPVGKIPTRFWADLPDINPQSALLDAARSFWNVPQGADILAAPGVSALIAQIPRLAQPGIVRLYKPTYNEHEASFRALGWSVKPSGNAQVIVHPNNPDGRLASANEVTSHHRDLTIIDESFCDVCPAQSLITLAEKPGIVVLKGLGKFWGLAGLRLGFAIARPETAAQLSRMLGPWAISGPAQFIGAAALSDPLWAQQTRQSLASGAAKLDSLMQPVGISEPCGTTLFRLYQVDDARALQAKLARHQIWTRVFPYSDSLIRFGMPVASDWQRLELAIEET